MTVQVAGLGPPWTAVGDFFAGDESEAYLADPRNIGVYDVNTVANYDPAITPYLTGPAGWVFIRIGDRFEREPLQADGERD